MRKHVLSFAFLLLIAGSMGALKAQKSQSYLYEVPSSPWEESFGNHRAILQIEKPAKVVALDFEWRRPDKDVDDRRFLVIHAATGDTIRNIRRIEVNNEHCRLQFGPVKEKGTYYFYYLPYRVQNGYGFYSGGYIPKESAPDATWLSEAEATRKSPQAKVVKVESRQAFDSFYPMEVVATAREKENYINRNKASLYLFAEDRRFPIRMRNNLPTKWLTDKQGKLFRGEAAPNEYYTFQIGLWAAVNQADKITYRASSLKCGREIISATAITCFNVEGTDPYGKAFKKEVNVPKGKVQALWFGVDIPDGQKEGVYTGTITISDANGAQGVVPVSIRIAGEPLADRGDNELWRYSRLRWLNSTLGIADTPTAPYTAMTVDENRIGCLGRTVTVDETTGLPAQIRSWNNDVLSSPMRFVIQTAAGVKELKAIPELTEHTEGHVTGSWKAEDEEMTVSCKAIMEFDGWMNYVYTITPKKRIEVKDIRLVLPVTNKVGTYFLGMGLPGQATPQQYDGKWDAPEKTVNNFGVSIPTSKEQQWLWPFDSFWIGNEHAGIHCEFRGSTYSGPLLNLYRPAYPESWFNGGKGGFAIRKEAE